jgi:hypothetical protein
MKMDVQSSSSYEDDENHSTTEVNIAPSHFDVTKGIAGVAMHITTITKSFIGKKETKDVYTESKIFKVDDAIKIGKAMVEQAESIKAENRSGVNTKFTEV